MKQFFRAFFYLFVVHAVICKINEIFYFVVQKSKNVSMNKKLDLSPSTLCSPTLSLCLFVHRFIHSAEGRSVTILVFSGACWSNSKVSLALNCSNAYLFVLALLSSMMFFRCLLKFSLLIVSNFLPGIERFVGIGFGQGISNVNALRSERHFSCTCTKCTLSKLSVMGQSRIIMVLYVSLLVDNLMESMSVENVTYSCYIRADAAFQSKLKSSRRIGHQCFLMKLSRRS